ncbi:unnamed protein product [marine sediment metagenome]|uniref:Uncharacterized protein n=1 Tax=marine sediment metagenome TaxID=412755 RepID=X1SCK6_9ZZZZ
MNIPKIIAGVFAGAGALYLIYKGHIDVAAGLLGSMCGFFVGEANGKRLANKEFA